ncbi:MAG: hypothetical protein WEB93_00325 [Sphingomonadales bacterium]
MAGHIRRFYRASAKLGAKLGQVFSTVVDRAFKALRSKSGVSGPGISSEIAGAATIRLYREVIRRLETEYGPGHESLVAPLFALAEFEAGRGEVDRARRAASAAKAIVLRRWGRRHLLWPLVEARHNAINAGVRAKVGKVNLREAGRRSQSGESPSCG